MAVESAKGDCVRLDWIAAIALAIFFSACTSPAQGQVPGLRTVSATGEPQVSSEIFREIKDPHTGIRWLLMRDLDHPGGPGRMVAVIGAATEVHTQQSIHSSSPAFKSAPAFVIHAGDHLILEESSARVEARLEAVALGSATSGSPLSVRLVLGGKVVRARALRPGHAAFAFESGVRP